jgi:glyoxylase-like metal-dependent hydrolase (beta-lactamase superfamily II)
MLRTVILLLLLTSPAFAQTPLADTKRTVGRDSSAILEKLAEGVYAIRHNSATPDWPHGNTGVVVGDNGVLVVDATYLPSRARMDIALIRTVTDKPVRYLVNTHWHGDHTHGNGVYREMFPDVVIVSSVGSDQWIATNQARYPASVSATGNAERTIAEQERTLAAGRDTAGTMLSDEEKARLTNSIRRRRNELAELRNVKVEPPTLAFDNQLTLRLGTRQVELRNWGRANSPADVSVYVPDAQALFAGDIMVHPMPYVSGSFPVPWISVLRGLELLPVTALVPGHGAVQDDHTYTRNLRALFEAARDRVRDLMVQGRQMEDIKAAVDLTDFAARLGNGDAEYTQYAQEWLSGLDGKFFIERMHYCVQGYAC